ncbi:MAG TPA: hypothetical protein DCL29_08125 [Eubacterium sp.]|nr:hypothetical protein [Eubacterium sp.]HAV91403.1 hypothetical protein [Eubacterium sp.]
MLETTILTNKGRNMIRLVVSDVDGTLLRNGDTQIPEEVIEYIKQFKEKGILFAVASGREYTSLRRLFEPVKDDIVFICVNGALVVYNEQLISKSFLDKRTAFKISEEILKEPRCELMISGEEKTYSKVKNQSFADHITKDLNNILEEIKNLRDIKEEVIKVSAFREGNIDDFAQKLQKEWGNSLYVVQSQPRWVDITAPYVTKGNALIKVQEAFGISEEDTMAFGDNYNDLDMFEHAFFSYAMQDSYPDIRRAARFLAPDVATILQDVIRM